MHRRYDPSSFSFLACLLLIARVAAAAQPFATSSPEAFTASVLPALQSELESSGTKATATLESPLTIQVIAGGEKLQLSLDRVWAHCSQIPAECQSTTESFLAGTAKQLAVIAQGAPKASAAQLRLVVRDTRYVDALKARQPDILARRLVGDWWLVPLLDFPAAAKAATKQDLTQLGLDVPKLEAAALTNTKREVGELAQLTRALPEKGIGYLTPRAYYNSGLLADASAWATLARQMKGKLLVSAPNDVMVLYIDSAQPRGAEVLAGITQKMYREADRGISTQIVEWTSAGWKPFTPSKYGLDDEAHAPPPVNPAAYGHPNYGQR